MSQSHHYPFTEIEQRIQGRWQQENRYSVSEDDSREKFYCLAMFPYPSGRLHMGHVRNYTIADAIARYQRQQGKNVLQPIGWDAFGLPAENAANEHGIDPRQWTEKNIDYMRAQLKRMGISYDWQRELSTCDPDYYRWEQWFFTRLYEKGLVYRRLSEVNWDPVDQTVLANEQVVDGRGWRSGALIERRSIEQWFVRITDYAEQLLDGLDRLEHWPSQVLQMQRNWIGRSHGCEIEFDRAGTDERLSVFTTRADTLFGVVALVVAPSHPMALECASHDKELEKALEKMSSDARSQAELSTANKQGYRTDVQAVHPFTGESLPVFVGNYVLAEYGSGVVMMVPAHDQRDFEFAKKLSLPLRAVVLPEDDSLSTDTSDWQRAYEGEGVLRASSDFDNLDSSTARLKIAEALKQLGRGRRQTSYRLRDWGVSRQRYWGCPIPIVYDDGKARPSQELPVRLPPLPSRGRGVQLRLGDHPDFATDKQPRRETDTLDTFFESSWYYARFCCPDFDRGMLDQRVRYWLPVDQYVGGIEHAVLHLLYFRFFHKLMRDEGLVEGDEPATKLLTQGMVVAHTWSILDDAGQRQWVSGEDLLIDYGDKGEIVSALHIPSSKPARYEGLHKMSKSMNNGVDPDSLMAQYGADAVRLYTLFTAPPEQSLEWSSENISGCTRFLNRLYDHICQHLDDLISARQRLTEDQLLEHNRANPALADDRYKLHSLLHKALYDYQRSQFNTVVAAAMEMMNSLYHCQNQRRATEEFNLEVCSIVLRLLSPICPHLCEELWSRIYDVQCIEEAGLAQVDELALLRQNIDMVVQLNGRKRGLLSVSVDADEQKCQSLAIEYCRDSGLIDGDTTVNRVIVVKNKLINIVCCRS